MRVPPLGVALGCAVVLTLTGTSTGLADPLVTVRYDGVGRVELVGTGWNPNDHAVVLVNSKEVAVTADDAGNFDVPAPLPAPGEIGFALSWRRDTDAARGPASILSAVVLPVALTAAVLALVAAAGTLAMRRVYGHQDSKR